MVEWLTPAVSERALVLWQRWTGVVVVGYLIIRVRALTSAPPDWDPVALLGGLSGPVPTAVLWLLWLAALAGALLWVRRIESIQWVAPLGAVAFVLLLAHRSSGGQILWFDILPALHVLVLASVGTRFDPVRAGWAMRLASLITVITYVLAGVAKLRYGGLEWVSEGALERNIAFSAARFDTLGGTPSPFAAALLDLGFISIPLGIGVVAIELGAPLALLNNRVGWAWSGLAWFMHLVIAGTMFVIFHWPLFGIAFVPLLLLSKQSHRVTV